MQFWWQKYRSHRKHLLAREAEAARLSQRKQFMGAASVGRGGGGKRDVNPWLPPTMGFPPMTPMHHFRPFHVWGHHTMDQSFMHMWPKHLPYSPSAPAWPPRTAPSPPPPDPLYWHQHQRVNSFDYENSFNHIQVANFLQWNQPICSYILCLSI